MSDDAPGPAQHEVALGVVAVARRLGVATGTLRTWDRRYGLGPTEHLSGTRRRYTARDLARLGVMRRLMLEGVAAGDAARAAVDTDVDALLADDPNGRAAVPPDVPAPGRTRRGGGRVVPLRNASPGARGLAGAAMSLDGDACAAMVTSSVRRRGVVHTWDDLVVPVLTGVGERWRTTGSGVEVEHLLSESVEAGLRAGVRRRPPASVRPVLLAALEPEDHRLPLVALSAALAEAGLPLRLLGPRLPVRALADAVSRTGPSAVFLWSQGAAGPPLLPDPDGWVAVRPRPLILLGGPGWSERDRWQSGASWVADLPEAVEAVRIVTATAPTR
ncbi:MAG TPA: MerR family transcriptional regulator [Actinomycetes bacterium]|nr:MerR family transcriptional regulator [Actinomycetes bacterium]